MRKKAISGKETVCILIWSIEEILVKFRKKIFEHRNLTLLLMSPFARSAVRRRKAGSRKKNIFCFPGNWFSGPIFTKNE